MAAAIGIDLGSNKAVMGVVKRKGIEIVLNDGSNRTTPVVIAYCAQERLIGDSVKTQIKRNFKNSILFPTRFLGLNAQCQAQLEIEKRFTTHKVVPMANNKIGFEVQQAGNTHIFTIEQILAFYLCKLHEFYQKDEVTTKDIVVSIPSYASNTERQALVDAADIAGLKCLRVINESTAICYNYGFFRKNDLSKEQERIVAFVDLGHSKTTVTIAGFKQQEARIICHRSDRNLGGRDMDYQIMQKLSEEFTAKYGCDPRESPRCRLRLYETIEKARKLLSGDTEAHISIDYLMEEQDLNRKLTRDEFEQLIDPQVRQLTVLLRASIEASGLSLDKIDFVELVGDCTRTPIVQGIIKQIFEKEELSRTLNASECIARGSALNSAMITPHFTVQDFTMNDYNNNPVNVNYQFTDPETNQPKEPKEYRNFFELGQKFPLVQQLKFDNKEGLLQLKIDYSDQAQILPGLPTSIAQYDIGRGKRSKADVPGSTTKLCIRVKNDVNQIPVLERVEMSEHWTEEEKIPIKTSGGTKAAASAPPKEEAKAEAPAAGEGGAEAAPAEDAKAPEEPAPAQPEEQKFEIKTRKKERTTDVSFKTISHAIPPDLKVQFRNLENQLMIEDRQILDLKEAKYNLESYTYEMKNGVAEYGNYEHFIDPTLKPTFLENLQATEEWIYADGENAPLNEQRGRLEALQSIGNPIKARYRFRQEFDDYLQIYHKYETQATARMAEVAHLTDDQRKQIADKCALMQQYYLELKSEMEAKQRHEDLSVTLADIEKKQILFESEVNAILNSPPPPPPKKEEEKKAEAPAADSGADAGQAPAGGDTEMKEETAAAGDASQQAAPEQPAAQ